MQSDKADIKMVNLAQKYFLLLLFYQSASWAQERSVIYPDIIPGAKLEILSAPGFRSATECNSKCKLEYALPYDQEIVATGKKQVRSFEDQDGDTVLEEYIEIETTVGLKAVKGWVPADLTSHDRPSADPSMDDKTNAWFSTTPLARAEPQQNGFMKFCSGIKNFVFGSSIYEPGKSDIHSVSDKMKEDAAREKIPLYQTTKIVEQLIGKCAIENPKNLSEADLKGPISYDTFVLPTLMQQKFSIYKKEKDDAILVTQSPMSHVRDLNIPNLNAQKLIEIDALARTIYAEMAGCIPIGAQYGMAVARVIKNREAAVEKGRKELAELKKKYPNRTDLPEKPRDETEFLWEKSALHWPGKSLTTKLASSPVQFSGWNNHIIDFEELKKARKARQKELIASGTKPAEAVELANEEIKSNSKTLKYYKFNKSGMLHTLCPPSRADENYYDGRKPYPELLAIWHNTIKIAVEATLYPEQFAKKTDSIKDVLHYTSGRSSFLNFCPMNGAVVDGKKLESNRCLNLWIDPERSKVDCQKPKSKSEEPKKEKSTKASKTSKKEKQKDKSKAKEPQKTKKK